MEEVAGRGGGVESDVPPRIGAGAAGREGHISRRALQRELGPQRQSKMIVEAEHAVNRSPIEPTGERSQRGRNHDRQRQTRRLQWIRFPVFQVLHLEPCCMRGNVVRRRHRSQR